MEGKGSDREFSVKVEDAFILPEIDAAREFIRQFKAELNADQALKDRFTEDPTGVLGDRGVFDDLQEEVIAATGAMGGECSQTCRNTCAVTGIE